MKREIHTVFVVFAFLAISACGFLRTPGDGASMEGMLVFTQAPVDAANRWRNGRYLEQTRIVTMDPDAPDLSAKVLTEGFYSARAPEISYDGKRLLFAGQRHKGSPWQIWEIKLAEGKTRQVTSGINGCTDPAYLPDGRIIFSAFDSNDSERTAKVSNALYTCNSDGSDLTRITFHPESDFAPTMLPDGRVLFVARPELLTKGTKLLAMRYDGMWTELFYENTQGGWQNSRVWATSGGELIFVESGSGESFGGRLTAISNKRPLRSRVDLAPGLPGEFHSAYPLTSGRLLVSYRAPGANAYTLHEFDPKEKRLGQPIYADTSVHALEPIIASKHRRPKTFVSLVNSEKMGALFYCLDANQSDLPVKSALPPLTQATKVQVLGRDGVLGEVALEEDGSFYLEIPTDRPLRFQTLSAEGRVVRGPSAWIWARPNEKRGCIGCHEDRELAPENRAPLAITKPPVSLLASQPSLTNDGHSSTQIRK